MVRVAMQIHIAALGVPLFDQGGLVLNERWQAFELEKLTPAGLDVIELYCGRLLQVHPADAVALAKAIGLEYHEAKFRFPPGKEPAKDAPGLGARHAAKAAKDSKGAPRS